MNTEYQKEYRAKHKAETAKYNKRYHSEYKEEIAKYNKKYKDDHRIETVKYNRKYRDEHRIEQAANERKYRQSPRGKESRKRYRQSPIGKIATRRARMRRRASGRVVKGTISMLLSENIFKYGIITCEACKEICEEDYHVDHITPVSKGGDNEYKNLQILCSHCNHSKYVNVINYKELNRGNQLILEKSH